MSKMDFRRWSWPFVISILANLVLFYLLAYVINSKTENRNTTTVLQIVLAKEKIQAESVEVSKKATVTPPVPAPVTPKKPVKKKAKVIPEKIESKSIEPRIQQPPAPEPIIEQLLDNRETVAEKIQEDTVVSPKPEINAIKPVPLFKLTRQPGGIKGEPVYPEHERALGREAYVMATVVIGTDGNVIEVQIVESGGEEFDNAVTLWLLNQQLTPGLINDTPVVSKINQPFRFVLR